MQIEDVKIRKHVFEIVEWFKNDGTFLDYISNEHEFNNLRNDLVEHSLTQECYFMWKNVKITLDEKGNMSDFPVGLYDQISNSFIKLRTLLKNKNAN